jgi:hypothetical protein
VSTKSTLIGIPAPSVVPPRGHAEGASATPAATAAAAAPSEPRSDTPVALSTHDATPDVKASSSDDERSEPSEPSEPSTGDGGPRGKDDEERAKRPFSNTRADSPQAKGERARQSAPLRVSVPPPDTGNSLSRWLMVSLVIAAVIMGGRWYLQSRGPKTTAEVAERTPAAVAAATDAPRATPLAPSAVAAPQPTETTTAATASAEPSAAAPATAATDAPAPVASAAEPSAAPAEPSASTASPEGTRVVVVKISPPGARLFRKGKAVGTSPVTIELAPGEKRSFEVGMPGWVTRRLVVDGTKPEILIGLKPER